MQSISGTLNGRRIVTGTLALAVLVATGAYFVSQRAQIHTNTSGALARRAIRVVLAFQAAERIASVADGVIAVIALLARIVHVVAAETGVANRILVSDAILPRRVFAVDADLR